MILLIAGILLAIAFLVWLWKGPVQHLVGALIAGGSHPAEAWVIVTFLFGAVGLAVYAIWKILG